MSLLLDVSDLEHEVGQSLKFSVSGDAPALDLPDGGVEFGPIEVEGRALWTGETVLVEGRASAVATFICSRCLGEFRRRLSADFSREFRQVRQVPGEEPGRSAGVREEAGVPAAEAYDDQDVEDGPVAEEPLPYQDQTIDLAFPAWEALVLELPMKPVCDEACRGLCPVCGANLNERTCGCEAERADARFLSLKKLLEAKERGE